MLLSRVILSLSGPAFGDKHSRIFGLGGGGTDFDGSGMTLHFGGEVGEDGDRFGSR